MSLQNIKKTDASPSHYSMTVLHRLWRQVISEGDKESPRTAGSTVMEGRVGSNASFAGGGRHVSSIFSGRTNRTGIKRNVSVAEGKRAGGREREWKPRC